MLVWWQLGRSACCTDSCAYNWNCVFAELRVFVTIRCHVYHSSINGKCIYVFCLCWCFSVCCVLFKMLFQRVFFKAYEQLHVLQRSVAVVLRSGRISEHNGGERCRSSSLKTHQTHNPTTVKHSCAQVVICVFITLWRNHVYYATLHPMKQIA